MTIVAHTDGASRGNPGESGIGILLRDEQGSTLFEGSGYIGKATNNIAEYQALLACLKKTPRVAPSGKVTLTLCMGSTGFRFVRPYLKSLISLSCGSLLRTDAGKRELGRV